MIARRDIVVIGASAGGVEALADIARALPADLWAALLVVLHVGPEAHPVMAQLLSRVGRLPACYAAAGELIRPGCIYLAPPGHHLLVDGERIRLTTAPAEHGVRPAADVLFRSAAGACGPRVVGVVLSGSGCDGAAGLQAIRAAGGVAVVQDPTDAKVPEMPRRALASGPVDHCICRAEIASLLARLCKRSEASAASRRAPGGDGRAVAAGTSRYELVRQRIAENQRLLDLSRAQVEHVRGRLELFARWRAEHGNPKTEGGRRGKAG
jgi:two-component system chemotaxis response regulator CheB